jgi:phosphatidylglycerophosphatase A
VNRPQRGEALAHVLATWFGCGYFPAARGTWASAAGLLIAMLLERYAGWRPWHFAVLVAVLLGPGIWVAGKEARRLGPKDPPQVVIDEVLGQWLTLAGARALNWKSYLAAFLLFRMFDIWKPAPARRLESLPGGLGIVADDLAAAVYGALVLFAAGWFNLY